MPAQSQADSIRRVLDRIGCAGQSAVHVWVGQLPDPPLANIPLAIAAKVSLPTARQRATKPFDPRDWSDPFFVRVNRQAAVRGVAFMLSSGLAFSRSENLRPELLADIDAAFGDLSEDAAFWAGSSTIPPGGWNPITDATFEMGVIGHSRALSFIAWVEDED